MVSFIRACAGPLVESPIRRILVWRTLLRTTPGVKPRPVLRREDTFQYVKNRTPTIHPLAVQQFKAMC
jgi:hypothetical protein